ncbi:MAG: Hsp20/alpha crystallin family protein [Acidobacteria bacterium]|nr:Hsp20/alpha crystallin family protein [Acidobacteriota bacterium]
MSHETKPGRGSYFLSVPGRIEDLPLAGVWTPRVDMAERDGKLLVSVAMPGVSRSDVSVFMRSNVLIIRGLKREAEAAPEYTCYYCMERDFGRFHREITLPWLVDVHTAVAALNNGVLRLTLTPMEERRGQIHEIPIST